MILSPMILSLFLSSLCPLCLCGSNFPIAVRGAVMSDITRWDERYEKGETPWDTGRPSSELLRVLAEESVTPDRAVELGCGTGANAVWLAQQGFDVTALDLSPLAVEQGRQRARAAGV